MGRKAESFAQWRIRENMKEYNFYYKNYRQLIQSMFKWINLPDGISSYFIEKHLFDTGYLIYFKSKMGFDVVSLATAVGLNDYEEPVAYRARSVTGEINELVNAEDCVVIRNNPFGYGNASDVNYYAKTLSNIKKTFEVNLEQLKNPFIIACPETQKTSVEQVMMQKTDGVPYIVTSTDFKDLVTINVFNLDIQDNTASLLNVMNQFQNDGLTHFGINNVNVLKKERLVTGEANQNNEQISLNKIAMYDERKKACELIKEKFGRNVQVELNTELYASIEQSEPQRGENNVLGN